MTPGCVRRMTLALLVLTASSALAQIPNAGFEGWTSGEPNGWITNNIPSIVTTVTQSSIRHTGSWAARIAVGSLSGTPFAPQLISHFPVSQRHANLTLWHQFAPVSGDAAAVVALMFRNQTVIGGGAGETYATTGSWELVDIDIEYSTGEIPDSCYITFVIVGDSISGNPHIGSAALVDDLAFVGISSSENEETVTTDFRLEQNYPNPFNPNTSITYQLPTEGQIKLTVLDLLGREVATLVNEVKQPGVHTVDWDASSAASGVYFYKLKAGNFTATRKLVLLK